MSDNSSSKDIIQRLAFIKYLAIIAILICSSVSLAAPRPRSIRSPAVPLWTQPETWQKLEKKMTSQQVQRILGKPASQRTVAAGMIWFYEEGNITDSCVKFRGSNSTYTVYTWTEPNFDTIQAEEKAKRQAEEAVAEKTRQADIEKKRLEAELKQAQIEKAQLARKLQAEQRARKQQERIAERKAVLSKQPEKTDNPFDTPVAGGVTAKIFIYAGGGFLALALLYVCFCRKTWH